MSEPIIKLGEHYLLWSSMTDRPSTWGMKLDEFVAWYKNEYGAYGLSKLPARLERVHQWGTSMMDGETPEQMVSLNRAGPNESWLAYDEIVNVYCLRKPLNGWIPEYF